MSRGRFWAHLGAPLFHLFDARILWTALPALLVLLYVDSALIKALCTLALFVLIAVGAAHWVRKTLFPYLDIEALYQAALGTEQRQVEGKWLAVHDGPPNLAAAVVLTAIVTFELGLIYLVVQAGMR